ncbi:hypothetical protein JOQ06_018681, partial [Pogonophryne albipinna]
KELDMDFDKMVEKEPDPEAPAEPLRSLGTKPVNIMLDVAFAVEITMNTYIPTHGHSKALSRPSGAKIQFLA